MRAYGALSPIDQIPQPPDTVQIMLLLGGTGQAMDWATSTGAVANARTAGAQLVRFTGITTAGAAYNFHVDLMSTYAALPTSGTFVCTGTTVGSSGKSYPVIGERMYQVPAWSTGWSAIGRTSGYVIVEQWKM